MSESVYLCVIAEAALGPLQHQRAVRLRCCGGPKPRPVFILESISLVFQP